VGFKKFYQQYGKSIVIADMQLALSRHRVAN